MSSVPATIACFTSSARSSKRKKFVTVARELGEKISIQPGPNGDYVLKLGFANLSSLEGTLQRLLELIGQIRATAGPRVRERPQAPSADAVADSEESTV